jgi:hypothetical protein
LDAEARRNGDRNAEKKKEKRKNKKRESAEQAEFAEQAEQSGGSRAPNPQDSSDCRCLSVARFCFAKPA